MQYTDGINVMKKKKITKSIGKINKNKSKHISPLKQTLDKKTVSLHFDSSGTNYHFLALILFLTIADDASSRLLKNVIRHEEKMNVTPEVLSRLRRLASSAVKRNVAQRKGGSEKNGGTNTEELERGTKPNEENEANSGSGTSTGNSNT